MVAGFNWVHKRRRLVLRCQPMRPAVVGKCGGPDPELRADSDPEATLRIDFDVLPPILKRGVWSLRPMRLALSQMSAVEMWLEESCASPPSPLGLSE
jgi:hypothetical protein